MSRNPHITSSIETKVYWTISILLLLMGVLFPFIELSGFYNVVIAGEAGAYPFGNLNENQWYYQSADIYWKYTLVNGLAFLTARLFTFISMIKREKRLSIINAAIIGLLLLVHFINMASY